VEGARDELVEALEDREPAPARKRSRRKPAEE
jgi:hypothetical protein